MVEVQMTEKEGREADPDCTKEKIVSNVTKRVFSYSLKKTKDYNSVSMTEGFEMTLPDGELKAEDIETFDINKKLIIERVNKEVEQLLWANSEKKVNELERKEQVVKENLKLIL